MSFSNARITSAVLVALLATPATLVRAADDAAANAPIPVGSIRTSIERATAALVAQPAASRASGNAVARSSSAASNVPLALPRTGRSRKSAGMIIMSLVGTGAGLAGTYYMVKTMNDQTRTATATPTSSK